MNRFIRSFFLLFIPLLAAWGQDANGTSTVTFGLGAGKPLDPYYGVSGGPQLNGSYEYRIRKHLSAEFGVDSSFVTVPKTTTSVSTVYSSIPPYFSTSTYTYTNSSAGARATAMPFGFRGILPLFHGRMEALAGAGGVYVWDPTLFFSRTGGWGWQGNLGVRMAVDKRGRFWLGSTGRYVDGQSAAVAHWLVWTADVSYRFGGEK